MIELHGDFPQQIVITPKGRQCIADSADFIRSARPDDVERCFAFHDETVSP
jgi:hypothetical protein